MGQGGVAPLPIPLQDLSRRLGHTEGHDGLLPAHGKPRELGRDARLQVLGPKPLVKEAVQTRDGLLELALRAGLVGLARRLPAFLRRGSLGGLTLRLCSSRDRVASHGRAIGHASDEAHGHNEKDHRKQTGEPSPSPPPERPQHGHHPLE